MTEPTALAPSPSPSPVGPQAEDLIARAFPKLDWSAPGRRECIDELVRFAEGEARQSSDWYFVKRRYKRRRGTTLRILAMVLVACAGALPIISQILQSHEAAVWAPPGAASIMLVLAGLFILLDKFGGHTSGWIRYIETGQQITLLLQGFRFDDQVLRLAWGTDEPSDAQVSEHIKLCRGLVMGVRQLEQKETSQWASEFRDALKQIDDSTTQKPTELGVGALHLTIDNASELVPSGWQVSLNGGTPKARLGGSIALPRLTPGLVQVTVTQVLPADSTDTPRQQDLMVAIVAGEVTEQHITL